MTRTMNDIAKYCAVRHYNIYDQMPPLNNEVLSESTDDKIVLKCPWCGKRYVLDPYYADVAERLTISESQPYSYIRFSKECPDCTYILVSSAYLDKWNGTKLDRSKGRLE